MRTGQEGLAGAFNHYEIAPGKPGVSESMRLRSVSLASAALLLPMQALAQAVPPPAVTQPPPAVRSQARPPATAPAPAPAPAADPLAPPAAAVPAIEESPPPLWQVADANDLLAFIMGIGSEGLDPQDYDPAGLTLAMRSGDPM